MSKKAKSAILYGMFNFFYKSCVFRIKIFSWVDSFLAELKISPFVVF